MITFLGLFDVDDLMLNTVGGTLGYKLFILVKNSSQDRRKLKQSNLKQR